jgi:hypothetical protein
MVDSCGTGAPTPRRSRITRPASWAYSAITANEHAPVRTAHVPNDRIASTLWRIPRALQPSAVLTLGQPTLRRHAVVVYVTRSAT